MLFFKKIFTLSSADATKSIFQITFFCWLSKGQIVWLRLGDPFVPQNPREFVCLILQDRFCVVHIPLVLYRHLQHHNVTIINTQEDFFNKICTSHFIAWVRKGYSRFPCERELETEQKLQYFDSHSYGRQRCVFLVLQMLNRTPRGPLCRVMAFFTESYQHHLWTPTHQGPKPLRPGVAFLTTSRL